ncbi:MAG: class IV adenylate cyclase [Rhizobiaceae bacterium]
MKPPKAEPVILPLTLEPASVRIRLGDRKEEVNSVPRNIELKAKLQDIDSTFTRASGLAVQAPQEIWQQDIFFNSTNGRLKLRILSATEGQLISYQRADQPEVRVSTYHVLETSEPKELRSLLSAALGERAEVTKLRTLLLVGRTRIHLDRVENLGDYIELEVVMQDGDCEQAAIAEADALMHKLEIDPGSLIGTAYVDLLAAK